MENKVQVKIQWSEGTAIIETEHGLKWSFKGPWWSSFREDNLTSVAALASALLTVTIHYWVKRSKADSVCFTLTAEDVFKKDEI